MNIKDLVTNTNKLPYKELCTTLIQKFGVKQPVNWESVLPHQQQQGLFGGEILRLITDHPTLATQKEIRPICLMKGDISQLLFFYVQLKDNKLPKAIIERITRKFIGGSAADRHIIWFFSNKEAETLKIVISGKEGKKIKLKTLPLEAGQWFKTYDFILDEVNRRFDNYYLFPSLKEPSELWKSLWEAFDISIVNKKFYIEIKAVFDALTKEELPKCKSILVNEHDRIQFAIRLIGRILFCWFLKRKGIINDDVLSAKAVGTQNNYYRNLLEKLFFGVLNTPENEREQGIPDLMKYYPFLNGGLFEPHDNDYKGNWILQISNDWFTNFFSNTLERYNFTVDENSSVSAEIAIDPEMLGRIFENLLAEQNPDTGQSARKSTGSYYTPREIVDYMVEESLIAYLKTNSTNLSLRAEDDAIPNAIEDFVHTTAISEDLKPHSKELLNHLNAIKILDPACGSGAFPISMLQKIVELKHQLDAQTSLYELKLKTIENSIYGVDIQPMATELSRLRCWLSLIVDEDPKNIRPLPNLDFKFVTANSLIELGYDELVQKAKLGQKGQTGRMFLTEYFKKMDELRTVRQKYFDMAINQNEKDKLKKEFNNTKHDIYKISLELIKQKLLDAGFSNKLTGWQPFDDSKPAPFFDKSWMFGVEEGFDLVIANPPYVRADNPDFKAQRDAIMQSGRYETLYEKWDLFIPFIEQGLKLLSRSGFLSYITSKFAFRLLEYIQHNYATQFIDYFSDDTKVFDAGVVPVVFGVSRQAVSPSVRKTIHHGEFNSVVRQEIIPLMDFKSLGRDAFRLSSNSFKPTMKTISLGDICYLSYGLRPNSDERYWRGEFTRDDLVSETKDATHPMPYVEGKNISRYRIDKILYLEWGTERVPKKLVRQTFPELYNRPKILCGIMTGCTFDDDYIICNHSIVVLVRFAELQSIDNKSISGSLKKFNSTSRTELEKISDRFDLKYNLAILNSKFANSYLNNIRRHRLENYFYPDDFRKLPIADVSVEEQKPFINLVDKILAITKSSDYLENPTKKEEVKEYEKQIDRMVYKLYDLTPDEIAIIEGGE